jgi:hypothetical protein
MITSDEALRLAAERIIELERKLESLTTERDQARYGEQDLQNQLDNAHARLEGCLAALMDLDIGLQIGDWQRARNASNAMAEALK